MKPKHTPGPWRISRITQFTVEDESGRSVAAAGGYQSNVDSARIHYENIANALLISCAPELLEALETMTELCELKYGNIDDVVYSTIEEAKEIIKKAKGE